jgi:hypothetical protein
MDSSPARAYGVFKPVGHMVVSFPTAAQADDGSGAAGAETCPSRTYGATPTGKCWPRSTKTCDRPARGRRGPGTQSGQGPPGLAERGYHWLVVRVDSDEAARNAADALQGRRHMSAASTAASSSSVDRTRRRSAPGQRVARPGPGRPDTFRREAERAQIRPAPARNGTPQPERWVACDGQARRLPLIFTATFVKGDAMDFCPG